MLRKKILLLFRRDVIFGLLTVSSGVLIARGLSPQEFEVWATLLVGLSVVELLLRSRVEVAGIYAIGKRATSPAVIFQASIFYNLIASLILYVTLSNLNWTLRIDSSALLNIYYVEIFSSWFFCYLFNLGISSIWLAENKYHEYLVIGIISNGLFFVSLFFAYFTSIDLSTVIWARVLSTLCGTIWCFTATSSMGLKPKSFLCFYGQIRSTFKMDFYLLGILNGGQGVAGRVACGVIFPLMLPFYQQAAQLVSYLGKCLNSIPTAVYPHSAQGGDGSIVSSLNIIISIFGLAVSIIFVLSTWLGEEAFVFIYGERFGTSAAFFNILILGAGATIAANVLAGYLNGIGRSRTVVIIRAATLCFLICALGVLFVLTNTVDIGHPSYLYLPIIVTVTMFIQLFFLRVNIN